VEGSPGQIDMDADGGYLGGGFRPQTPARQVFGLLAILLSVGSACGALTVGVTAPEYVNICDEYSYSVAISNGGTLAERDILANVTVPILFNYQAGSTRIVHPGGTSAQEPVSIGGILQWNLSDIMGSALQPGQGINLTFNLTAACGAKSGQYLKADITSNRSSVAAYTRASITVYRGLLKVTKQPNVIEAPKGDYANWTIAIENLGTGPAYNVRVNDTLESGLELIAIDSPGGGMNWSYDEIPASESRTVNISTRIIACNDLYNIVNASWGCDGTPCQKTYTKASVKLMERHPYMSYSFDPDPMLAPYCDSLRVTCHIVNTGDGNALDLKLVLDGFPAEYTITNTTGGTYHPGNTTFYVGTIPPSSSQDLAFDFSLQAGLCRGPSGILATKPYFYDDCLFQWTPPTKLLGYGFNSSGKPSLSASKSGPGSLYLGERARYNLSAIYEKGLCPQENVTVNITDSYPANFIIVDAGNGTVSGSNITWADQVLDDDVSWTDIITLEASSDPCDCGTSQTNALSVENLTDCCGCELGGSSSTTILVKCYNGTVFNSSKSYSPAPQQNCENLTYTTTYRFNETGTLTWADIDFKEAGNNSQTFPGGLLQGEAAFTVNDTCSANETLTLGVALNLGFLEAGCGPLSDGDILNVSYTLYQNDPGSFEDWSYLCISGSPAECSGKPCYQEAAAVSVGRSDWSLDMTLSNKMESCGVYNFTLELSKNGPWNGSRMNITYDEADFKYIGPAIISGIVNSTGPVASFEPEPDGDNMTWSLGDDVSSGGTIAFPVEKSCIQDKQVNAWLEYVDNCDNPLDDEYHGAPLLLDQALITISKNPEVIFALTKNASWKIYIYNSGSGTAYNTIVDDLLDDDLLYHDSKIRGVDDPANTTVSGQNVTWTLGDLAPQEVVFIELNATLDGCYNLNNYVNASWGCGGKPCDTVNDSSRVELLNSELQVVRHEAELVDECDIASNFSLEVWNVGPTCVYNVTISELLPAGLQYIPGSSVVTGVTPTGVDLGGNPLIWYFNNSEGCAKDARVRIDFKANMSGPCSFINGTSLARVNYTTPCGAYGLESQRGAVTLLGESNISLIKSPNFERPRKDSIINWTITLYNDGDSTARNITLEDLLPTNTNYYPAETSPLPSSGDGNASNPLHWDIADMPVGTTINITVAAKVTLSTYVDTYNNATVYWGCCPWQLAFVSTAMRTRPEVTLAKSSGYIDTCGGSYTITMSNIGSRAFTQEIKDVLPQGFIYETGSAVIATNNATHEPFLVDEPVFDAANRSLIWNSTNIDILWRDETITLAFNTTNCQDCCNQTIIPNSNEVFYNFTDRSHNTYNLSDTLAVSPKIAILNVTKEPFTQTVTNPARWTIALTNPGSGTGYNVSVMDVLDEGFTSITTDGAVHNDYPLSGWTTINWTGITLNAGATWSRDLEAYANSTGNLTNNVYAWGTCDDGCIYSQDSDAAYTARLYVTKEDDSTLTIGEWANFTLTAEFWGIGESYNLTEMNDPLPTGLRYESWQCFQDTAGTCGTFTEVSNDLTWDLGNFTGPRVIVINLSTIVEDVITNQDGVVLENRVDVTHQDRDGHPFLASDQANVSMVEPDLRIEKAVNASGVEVGDTLRYNVTVDHTADSGSTAYDLNVTDIAPAGLTLTSAGSNPPADATQIDGRRVTWLYENLSLADALQLSYNATVDPGALANLTILNNATVLWNSTAEPNSETRYGGWTSLDDYNRDIQVASNYSDNATISKLPDQPRNSSIGYPVNYSIIVDMARVTFFDIWVNDTLPQGLIYENATLNVSGAVSSILGIEVSSPNDGTVPVNVNWHIGDVNNSANEDLVIEFNATVAGTAINRLGIILDPNDALLRYKDAYGNPYSISDSSSVMHLPAIDVNKTVSYPPEYPNENLTFSINVTNTGNVSLDPIVVWDLLPLGLEYVSSNPSGVHYNRYVNWTVAGPLLPGETTTLELVARLDGTDYGALVNYVNATGVPYDVENVTDDDYATVRAVNSSIEIQKDADVAEAHPNQLVNFTIRVTNTGDVVQRTVRVVDILPAGMDYVSHNGTATISGNMITWENAGPLGPGNSTYLRVTGRAK